MLGQTVHYKNYFAATERAKGELNTFLNHDHIPAHVREFIDVVITLQLLNDDQPVERTVVTSQLESRGVGASKATMSQREKELLNLGVLEDVDAEINDKPVIIRRVVKLTPLMSEAVRKKMAPSRTNRRIGSRQIELKFEELQNDFNVLLPTDQSTGRIERLFTGILDAAVRLSSNDKRKTIECRYQFGDEHIDITTTSLAKEDSELMQLSDYRVIRALNSMYVEYVEREIGPIKRLSDEQKRAINGDFVFDIYDLCEEIGFDRKKRLADIVRGILRRIKDTVFEVNAEGSPVFRNTFAQSAHEAEFRYLTEARSYKEYETVDGEGEGSGLVDFAARIYIVRFHSIVLTNLLNDDTRFTAHPELATERSGIAHRFNNWCKIIIGVRPKKGNNQRQFLMDELWERVLSTSRLDNFCRYFEDLLGRECLEGKDAWDTNKPNRSLIYGYYVEYDPDPAAIRELMRKKGRRVRRGGKLYPVITIWRDTEDPYVGDNSDHNQALRRQLNEATLPTPDDVYVAAEA